jgi:hypothetical protein
MIKQMQKQRRCLKRVNMLTPRRTVLAALAIFLCIGTPFPEMYTCLGLENRPELRTLQPRRIHLCALDCLAFVMR